MEKINDFESKSEPLWLQRAKTIALIISNLVIGDATRQINILKSQINPIEEKLQIERLLPMNADELSKFDKEGKSYVRIDMNSIAEFEQNLKLNEISTPFLTRDREGNHFSVINDVKSMKIDANISAESKIVKNDTNLQTENKFITVELDKTAGYLIKFAQGTDQVNAARDLGDDNIHKLYFIRKNGDILNKNYKEGDVENILTKCGMALNSNLKES